MLMIAVMQMIGCSRAIDSFIDGAGKNNKAVIRSEVECFSGASMYFRYSGENRVWISQGGHYEIILDDKIITLTGDCVVHEFFK